ncbi:hypothetical protein AAC387_Pa09g1902 [Persea americana]
MKRWEGDEWGLQADDDDALYCNREIENEDVKRWNRGTWEMPRNGCSGEWKGRCASVASEKKRCGFVSMSTKSMSLCGPLQPCWKTMQESKPERESCAFVTLVDEGKGEVSSRGRGRGN